MSKTQKWLIVSAICVAAIGLLFSGLRGRYQIKFHTRYDGDQMDSAGFIRKNTWTGKVFVFSTFPPNKDGWREIK